MGTENIPGTENGLRGVWYGQTSLDPIVCCVADDGPFGDRIVWWSYVVMPFPD